MWEPSIYNSAFALQNYRFCLASPLKKTVFFKNEKVTSVSLVLQERFSIGILHLTKFECLDSIGTVFAYIGTVLGLSWPVLGLPWAVLGLYWPILGMYWPVLRLYWPVLGLSWDVLRLYWDCLGL